MKREINVLNGTETQYTCSAVQYIEKKLLSKDKQCSQEKHKGQVSAAWQVS